MIHALKAIGAIGSLIAFGLFVLPRPDIQRPSFPSLVESTHTIVRNTTVGESLRKAGLDWGDIQSLVQAAKPVRDLAYIRNGIQYSLEKEPGPIDLPRRIRFSFSPIETLELTRANDGLWEAQKIISPVEFRTVTYTGKVQTSLWNSATSVGMDPDLIAELTEIFAWQVDFSREVQAGDRWRLVVEQKLVDNKPIGWGNIRAAEYKTDREVYTAVRFPAQGIRGSYYSPDGQSMKKMFLKNPIRLARITSRFKRNRFHPILKVRRPHLGVDYAAPTGTPIRAVGDGTVVYVGRRGGSGKTIKIRHNSVYRTHYKHLSGYGQGIRTGARVRQRDIIGYVGSTGLATGPHLHFEFFENGRFVDPLGRSWPSANPVSKDELPRFLEVAHQALRSLPPWHSPGVMVSLKETPPQVSIRDAKTE